MFLIRRTMRTSENGITSTGRGIAVLCYFNVLQLVLSSNMYEVLLYQRSKINPSTLQVKSKIRCTTDIIRRDKTCGAFFGRFVVLIVGRPQQLYPTCLVAVLVGLHASRLSVLLSVASRFVRVHADMI